MEKKNRVNIYDVVEEVGFLIFIVFCVLNDDVCISVKIKVKVKVVVILFGFQKNVIVISLLINQFKVIGVLVLEFNWGFLFFLVYNFEEMVFVMGYFVIICQINNFYEWEKIYIDMFIVSWVAGIIVMFFLEMEFYEYFEKVKEQGIKFVFVDWVFLKIKFIIKIVIDDY